MKILIDARLYGLENTGLGRYGINLISSLQKIDKKNDYVILLREKYYKSLKLKKNFKKVKADFRHYSVSEQTKLPKIIDEQKPDLIHFLHFNVPVRCRYPYVVTIHDLLMHKQKGKDSTTLPFYSYKLKRMGYHYVFRSAVTKAKKIIVPTKYIKRQLLEKYKKVDKDTVQAVYEGVDELYSKAPKRKLQVLRKYNLKTPYFIYTGNAYPHKNLSRALDAIAFLNKKYKATLVIVSARNYFVKKLEAEIKKQKAEKYVKVLGFVSDEELVALYQQSAAFLYPSLYEGFGLPGLEAMKAGTVVLASDISVFREVYKDSAMYFNPYDFSSIQRTMEQVLEMDDKKRKEQIVKGKKFVKRYLWEKMSKKILKIYENCASI